MKKLYPQNIKTTQYDINTEEYYFHNDKYDDSSNIMTLEIYDIYDWNNEELIGHIEIKSMKTRYEQKFGVTILGNLPTLFIKDKDNHTDYEINDFVKKVLIDSKKIS